MKDIHSFVANIQRSDIVACDFSYKNIGNLEFAQSISLASACYKAEVPAVLLAASMNAVIPRHSIRFIPGFIKNRSLEPERLIKAWDRCLNEFARRFEPWRRPWRTLVRIDAIDNKQKFVHVIVPAWNSRQKVRIDMAGLPLPIQRLISIDKRFHALVNTGTENYEELYFDERELE